MSLRDVVVSGDRVKALEALRDDLAARLDDCDSMRDYAALSQRLMDALKQLHELTGGPAQEKSPADEIAARRAARKRPSA